MRWAGAAALALSMAAAPAAEAFCGFFVSGADAKLFNSATSVVLAREGTHTVLSMQNNYQGPPEDFAMVVPVPVVLAKEAVKTLPRGLFERVDALSAPRLVEYWEQDPCMFEDARDMEGGTGTRAKGEEGSMGRATGNRFGVKVEARFDVDEYEIVILSADDALGLDGWLRAHGYRIPEGAEAVLRPYVQAGSKFFVARVDVAKAALEGGRAVLSPLRFEYDEETLRLPVRLGLINSGGKQDLIVHVLAKQRYDVANYPSVFIPTNLELDEAARDRFGEVYAALFDATLERHPGAVVTEYAWSVATCDPCPTGTLQGDELSLLGAGASRDVVHTRLHARYGRAALGEDLVLRVAPPVEGGREGDRQDAVAARQDNFQGRYVIRHPWRGGVRCAEPRYGVWGGPPFGDEAAVVQAARDLASAERGRVDLAAMLRVPAVGLGVEARAPAARDACGGRRFAVGGAVGAVLGVLAALGLRRVGRRSGRGAGVS